MIAICIAALLIGACSGPGGDKQAYCALAATIRDDAATQSDGGGNAAFMASLAETSGEMAKVAPDKIKSDAELVADGLAAIAERMEGGEEVQIGTAMSTDEFAEANEKISEYIADECD